MSEARVQVVERAIDILKALAGGPATLTEVTRATELPKGTAFRILGGLRYQNVVVKDPIDNTYQLGPGFLQLSHVQLHGFGALTTLAKPPLVKLWQETEETVALHVRMGVERICIEEIPSPNLIRYSAEAGAPAPLHVGSAGKILLAAMDESDRERIMTALTLEQVTDDTIGDRDSLVEAVSLARERGYAESVGERVPSAAAISVPVRVVAGGPVALSILGPADRLTAERRLAFLEQLKAAAADIEAATSVAEVPIGSKPRRRTR